MARVYTVDASVFLNAFNANEVGHADSYRFLLDLRNRGAAIVVPCLLLPEIAAAVARGRNDAILGRKFANAVRGLSHLTFVPLDSTLSLQAVDIAADYRLRGSDAVYGAVALRFGSTLVTLDLEQQ